MKPVLERLAEVADVLDAGGVEGVFVGGAVLPLLVDPVVRAELRATLDVDIVVHASSYTDYHRRCQSLLDAGFSPGLDDADPLCRYRRDDLTVDIMPVPFDGIGTDNPWFSDVLLTPDEHTLPLGQRIRVARAPVYLATKVAAFEGRGDDDYLGSKDFEDIIALLDGRAVLESEVLSSEPHIRQYLEDWATRLLQVRHLEDIVEGHIARASGPGRGATLVRLLKRISAGRER